MFWKERSFSFWFLMRTTGAFDRPGNSRSSTAWICDKTSPGQYSRFTVACVALYLNAAVRQRSCVGTLRRWRPHSVQHQFDESNDMFPDARVLARTRHQGAISTQANAPDPERERRHIRVRPVLRCITQHVGSISSSTSKSALFWYVLFSRTRMHFSPGDFAYDTSGYKSALFWHVLFRRTRMHLSPGDFAHDTSGYKSALFWYVLFRRTRMHLSPGDFAHDTSGYRRAARLRAATHDMPVRTGLSGRETQTCFGAATAA